MDIKLSVIIKCYQDIRILDCLESIYERCEIIVPYAGNSFIAKTIVDKLIVAVAVDSKKSTLFSAQERADMIKEAIKDLENVEVLSFSGLLTDFVRKNKANIIIRGMRAISDFEHESQLALMNKGLAPEIETIFLVTCSKYSYLNSSIVKEIASLNGNISQLVPEIVEKKLKTLFFNRKA